MYESTDAKAYWDVPVYAEHTYVKANTVVWAVEMSCPWIDNRKKEMTQYNINPRDIYLLT